MLNIRKHLRIPLLATPPRRNYRAHLVRISIRNNFGKPCTFSYKTLGLTFGLEETKRDYLNFWQGFLLYLSDIYHLIVGPNLNEK